MNIIEKKITELEPYPNNPRVNDGAVEAVAASIKRFGFKVPIVIGEDGIIIAGHTRLKAAKRLKLKTVPCVVADDLTEEEAKAFRLADNKVGELAEWDFDLLSDELDGITDIDMSDFGFDDDFSIENIYDGMDAEKDEGDWWTTKLTFPINKKKQVSAWMRLHKEEIVKEIIRRSGNG